MSEPEPWSLDALAEAILASRRGGRECVVVAVDGRSASGKSSLAERLAAGRPGWAIVHTDDIAWHHSFFDWADLLRTGVLAPLGPEGVRYRPPGWIARGRPGAVEVPAGTTVLLVEGVGASRAEVADLLDLALWVEVPRAEQRRREDERIASGHTDADLSRDWLAAEEAFLDADRPWARADLVVAGFTMDGVGPGEVGVLRAPGRRPAAQGRDESGSDMTEATTAGATDEPTGGPTDEWARPVRGLVLDIDDTLVDTQAAMRASCTAAAAAALPTRSAVEHEIISDVFYADPDDYFDRYTRGEFAFEDMRRARYRRALAELGMSEEGFEEFEAAYLEAFGENQALFADVEPLLDAAGAAGVAVCLLTNSGDQQTAIKLQAVGLEGRAPVVTTDTIGVGKPDPRLFAMACERAGVAPADAVCVGDTLPTDVVGARNAGLRVAWLQRPDRPEPRNAGWGTPLADPGVRIVAGLDEVAGWL